MQYIFLGFLHRRPASECAKQGVAAYSSIQTLSGDGDYQYPGVLPRSAFPRHRHQPAFFYFCYINIP
ncbi:hypothetical protein BDW69DRAFT_153841 [Aspergillus filifer]